MPATSSHRSLAAREEMPGDPAAPKTTARRARRSSSPPATAGRRRPSWRGCSPTSFAWTAARRWPSISIRPGTRRETAAWRPAPKPHRCQAPDGAVRLPDRRGWHRQGHRSRARLVCAVLQGRRGDRLHRRGLPARDGAGDPVRGKFATGLVQGPRRPAAAFSQGRGGAGIRRGDREGQKLRDQFRSRHAAAVPLQIAAAADPQGASGQVGALLCRLHARLPERRPARARRRTARTDQAHLPRVPRARTAFCSKSCARRSVGECGYSTGTARPRYGAYANAPRAGPACAPARRACAACRRRRGRAGR